MPLLAAFIGNALNPATLAFYSLGVLSPTLQREFGWGTGAVAGSLLAISITTLLIGSLVGSMVDRLGVRQVAVWSAALTALALSLFAFVPLSLGRYYGLWVLVAAAGAGILPITWSRLVNQHYRFKRGLALGISFVGTGVTGFLLKPLLFHVLEQHGFRGAFLTLAVLPLIAGASTLLLVRSASTQEDAARSSAARLAGMTLREAFCDWRFWLLAILVASASAGVGGPLPNMESVLRARGYSGAEAIAFAQFIGIAIVAGRIGGGALLDRFWAPAIGAFALVAGGVGCLAAWIHSTPHWTTGLQVFLIAVASGLEVELVAFLVVRYFGLKAYASIYGVLYGIFALATGAGAIGFGALFDAVGSYGPALASCGLLLVASAGAMLCLGPYRYYEQAR
jgi:predicted MFS family arabinose efflux permease